MKVSKRELTLLIALFTMICGFLYYRVYYVSATERIEAADAELETLQTQLSDMQLKAAAVNTLKSQLETLEAEAGTKLARALPSSDQPAMLVMTSDQLRGLCEESTLIFRRTDQNLPGASVASVQASFFTNYANFKTILERLSQAPHINRIVVCDLDRNLKAGVVNNLEVSLTIEFFTLGDKPSGSGYPFMGTPGNKLLFPT